MFAKYARHRLTAPEIRRAGRLRDQGDAALYGDEQERRRVVAAEQHLHARVELHRGYLPKGPVGPAEAHVDAAEGGPEGEQQRLAPRLGTVIW
ncbi:hypothetical protein LCGC14_2969430 [marine sediment metagenome]|uniref:Uncharacterized protein n=1 Tax=marine sediment metagenome TaxID=412755 RepID=A0A0F8XXD3_9ZZZZ